MWYNLNAIKQGAEGLHINDMGHKFWLGYHGNKLNWYSLKL